MKKGLTELGGVWGRNECKHAPQWENMAIISGLKNN